MITRFAGNSAAGKIQLIVLFSAVALGLSSCAVVEKLESLDDNDGYTLPVVEDESTAATIRVKSADNLSDQQFLHLLKVDDETIMKLAEGDRREFQLDPGTYQIEVTCHTVPNPDISNFPPNLRVVDGLDTLELTVEAGEEACLRVSKPLLSCAGVDQAAMSVCN